jgi:YggT family protein
MIAIELHVFPRIPGLILFTASGLLNKFLMFYFYAIVIRIILNLIPSARYHPAYFALVQLTEPLLRPARRIIPLIAGIDLSPILVIILLQVLSLLVIDNLIHVATKLLV